MIEKLKNFFKCPTPHIHDMTLKNYEEELEHDENLDRGGILYFLGWTEERALDNPHAGPFYKGSPHLDIHKGRYVITLEDTQCRSCEEIKKAYFLRLLPK